MLCSIALGLLGEYAHISTGQHIIGCQKMDSVYSSFACACTHTHTPHTHTHRNLTGAERQSLKVDESSTGTCLVAVARLQHFGEGGPKPSLESSENEFVTRVAMDGRFTYVDPRSV